MYQYKKHTEKQSKRLIPYPLYTAFHSLTILFFFVMQCMSSCSKVNRSQWPFLPLYDLQCFMDTITTSQYSSTSFRRGRHQCCGCTNYHRPKVPRTALLARCNMIVSHSCFTALTNLLLSSCQSLPQIIQNMSAQALSMLTRPLLASSQDVMLRMDMVKSIAVLLRDRLKQTHMAYGTMFTAYLAVLLCLALKTKDSDLPQDSPHHDSVRVFQRVSHTSSGTARNRSSTWSLSESTRTWFGAVTLVGRARSKSASPNPVPGRSRRNSLDSLSVTGSTVAARRMIISS